jgi:hypothetical protein
MCCVVSSSGLIYAGIVGAWAVYLVPVWLRREEQLNEAREKARYAAAIRTLGRSERFEKKVLAEEVLAATGTDGAPNRRPADKRAPEKQTPRKTAVLPTPASVESVKNLKNKPALKPKPSPSPAASPSAAAQPRKRVTARLPYQHQPAAKPSPAATAARRRGVLLMRRRRVVAALFTLATLGAIVSTFLGLAYIWAMLAPAALFSGYVVYIRRDEKQRARERYRRHQAALATERRRERQRQAEPRTAAPAAPADPMVRAPESTVWRPAQTPEEYRRAANG